MSWSRFGEELGPRWRVASPQYLCWRCVGRSLLSGWISVGRKEAPSVPDGSVLVARWWSWVCVGVLHAHSICVEDLLGVRCWAVGFQLGDQKPQVYPLEMCWSRFNEVLGSQGSVASLQYLCRRCVGRSLLSGWISVRGPESPSVPVPVGNELVARWWSIGSALECCKPTVFVLETC